MRVCRCLGTVCLALLVSCLARRVAQAAEDSKPVALTCSVFLPATHPHTVLATDWANEVAKRTDDLVQITVSPVDTLTAADQCYEDVEKGNMDIGMSVLDNARGRFPLCDVLGLPLGCPNGIVATELANAFYARFRPKELDDVKILYLHARGPSFLHTRAPVARLEDLKGMRIGCTGLPARIVTALGGTPVATPMGETYDALISGGIDGSVAPIESLVAWKWGEAVKSTTQAYGAACTTTFFVAMNRAQWEALPPAVQQSIDAVDEEWAGRAGTCWDAIDQAARDSVATHGTALITLSDAEEARWAQAVRPVLDEYVRSTAARGLPGQQALDFCQAFLDERQ